MDCNCGLAADVEPTKLHPQDPDNKRRVDIDLVVHAHLPEGSKLVDV